MSIVVIIRTLSRGSCRVRRQGCLVASRRCLSPWPPSLHLRCSSHERLGLSRWWRWSHPSRLVMALIASIAIRHVVVDCCCLPQLCLAPTLTLRSQLRFLLVYQTRNKRSYHSMIDSFYFIALTTIDRSILIGGVVVCCRLVQPTVANEIFSHAIFFGDQTNDLAKAQTMILAA